MRRCNESDRTKLLEYIGKDYGRCLYIFIDIMEYGLEDNEFKVWVQNDKDGKITAIVTKYYSGMQVYSKDVDYDSEDVAKLINENDCQLIFGAKETIDKLITYFPHLRVEDGIVGQLKSVKCEVSDRAYSAEIDELEEVVRIIAEDESIGKPYGFDSLYKQFVERKKANFGRNWITRDEETGEVICHAGTYAETKELAVIGGVITAPQYRGRGMAKPTLAAICKELQNENKDVFSFYYIPVAKAMHEGVGFESLCIWQKLYK